MFNLAWLISTGFFLGILIFEMENGDIIFTFFYLVWKVESIMCVIWVLSEWIEVDLHVFWYFWDFMQSKLVNLGFIALKWGSIENCTKPVWDSGSNPNMDWRNILF